VQHVSLLWYLSKVLLLLVPEVILVPDCCTLVARAHNWRPALAMHRVWRLCKLAAKPCGVVGGGFLAEHLGKECAQHWDP
jgi:hypothetical protein